MNSYVLCGTGIVGADTGTWYDPVGTELTPTSSPVSRVVNTNNAIAGYTSLVGVAVTPGVYTCEMPNAESGVLDYHTVALYPSNFFQGTKVKGFPGHQCKLNVHGVMLKL